MTNLIFAPFRVFYTIMRRCQSCYEEISRYINALWKLYYFNGYSKFELQLALVLYTYIVHIIVIFFLFLILQYCSLSFNKRLKKNVFILSCFVWFSALLFVFSPFSISFLGRRKRFHIYNIQSVVVYRISVWKWRKLSLWCWQHCNAKWARKTFTQFVAATSNV